MMRENVEIGRRLIKQWIMVVIAVIGIMLLSGCSGMFNMKNLKADSLDDGFFSIVVLNLTLTDTTGKKLFDSPRLVQAFFATTRDKQPTTDWVYSAINAKWPRKDGTTSHNGLYTGQARPVSA